MAFPSVVARTPSEQATDAGSFTVGLGGPSAGELLVAIISVDVAVGSNVPSWEIDTVASGTGWWMAGRQLQGTSGVGSVVAIKVAQGGGSDVLRILYNDGSPQQASAITFRISGHGSYAAIATANGSSTNGDPPNVAITGSAQDCLFIAAVCTNAQTVASAAPASYSNLTTAAATNVTGASVSVADRNLNATSDNPGTFTHASQPWIGWTIAIPENAITTNARQTQAPVEAVSQVDVNARVTQVVPEVATANFLNLLATQVVLESATPQTQNLYATQVVLEVLSGDPAVSSANKYRQIQIAC